MILRAIAGLLLVGALVLSLPVRLFGDEGVPVRVETRNLGHWLNAVLNYNETAKRKALVRLLKSDATTDVFLFQEISPDVRLYLEGEVRNLYDIIMDRYCVDTAVLVRKLPGWQIIPGSVEVTPSRVSQGGTGADTCSTYGRVSVDVARGSSRIRFISLHEPAQYSSWSVPIRKEEVDALRVSIERALTEGVALVVGGDFNLELRTYCNQKRCREDDEALFNLARLSQAADLNRSATCFFARYDYIFGFSPTGLGVTSIPGTYANPSASTQEILFTDHKRVRAQFMFQPNPGLLAFGLAGDPE